jgi:hypothetical protein
VAERLISENQTAFIKKRNILESVVSGHQIIHEVHSKNEQGLVLRFDYEKSIQPDELVFLG